ncbi:hypothetical protein ABZX93_10775 [Streptomyces sp. NPDC006632]|uniref:hypothetical protein n=1 Tax=Streptomyces sp. NPDC006632 TaxID=3157182 RepID=UPI00339F8624
MIIGVFAIVGLVALWCGASLAFNVRGIAVARAEAVRQRSGMRLDAVYSGGRWARPGYYRLLGAVLMLAGAVIVIAAYALWHLG